MKIIAKIIDPRNKEERIIHDTDLIDIATRDNLLVINKDSYLICRTLFKKLNYEGDYDFEQVIIKYPRKNLERYEPYLLIGTIQFNTEEKSSIFKNVTINYNTEYGNKNEKVDIPYNYMRHYDCIKIGDSTFMCNRIQVKGNSEIFIELTNKQPIIDFRLDKNDFCQSI